MKYEIKKNWLNTIEIVIKKPVILIPFIIFGFIQLLALEVLYFSYRRPLSLITSPIIKKYFGETFLHYPANMLLLPNLFHYIQMGLYVVIGVFLATISINLLKNVLLGLPIRRDAVFKNALRRLPAILIYGVVAIVLVGLLKQVDAFILKHLFALAAKEIPNLIVKLAPFISISLLFILNTILQVLLLLVLPLIVIKKKSLIKAFLISIGMGIRHFWTLFILIFLPFLVYLPVSLVKTRAIALKLAQATFPEINLFVAVIAIIISIFIDAFITLCAARYLIDTEGAE